MPLRVKCPTPPSEERSLLPLPVMPPCARPLAHLAAAVLIAVTACRTAGAATYYVAPTGNDGSAGTQAQPWRTLQKAGDVAGAGDTVLVAAGTYQGFRARKSGTAIAPVRFIAEPGVIVTTPSPANTNGDNIWVRNVDHVVIDGFETTAAPRAGIAVQGEPSANATGVVIRNCHAHDNARWGIFTGFARDLLIENNETSYSAIEHGIYVSNSGDHPTVRGNHVHHNRASGIQLNADPAQRGDDPADPQGDGIIASALIEGNVIHDNGTGGGAAINLASVRSSLIRNNLLYANRSTGIAGWDDGFSSAFGTRDNRIVGNTIVQAATGRFAIALKNGSINNAVLDNILLHPGSRGALEVDPSSRPGLQSDYNVLTGVFSDDTTFLTLTVWRALGFDTHSIVATVAAVFADAVQDDYRLSATSPARDVGLALGDLPTDIAGVTRPQGAGVDPGAYELVSGGPSPTPSRTMLPSATRTATPTSTRTTTASRTATTTRTPSAPALATPTTSASVRIRGTLRHAHSGVPIAGATLHVDDATGVAAASDASGLYELTTLAGTHTVAPRKRGARGNGVSALDAAFVLQHVAGRRTLDAADQLACDVSGNGQVTALDASRLLQFTVGALADLPAATLCGSDWVFVPRAVPGAQSSAPALDGVTCRAGALAAPLDGDRIGWDFDAVLIGDCTGNWQPAMAGAAMRRPPARTTTILRVRPRGAGRLRLALLVRSDTPFAAVTGSIAFGFPVRVTAIRPALSARGAIAAANPAPSGDLTVALAIGQPIAGGRRAAVIVDVSIPTASHPGPALTQLILDED